MYIYYKYATYEAKIVVLSYVDECVYWYTSEDLGTCFVENLGKIFHVKLLWYAHWFMSIIIYQMKDHSILLDHTRCDTSIVDKYLDTSTVKTSKRFYNNNFPSDMIFTKAEVSTSGEKVDKLTNQFNIHYRACIRSLINLLSTKVDLSCAVHKLAKFSSNPGKVIF